MKLLGDLLARALRALGHEYIQIAAPDPAFRGPTPPRVPRPRGRGTGTTYVRPVPKAPSKRDLHRMKGIK